LREGANLSGSNFAPLTSYPDTDKTIAGTAYRLVYDPDSGFSYINDDGSGMGFAGAGLPASASSLYALGDPITSSNLASALQRLGELDPSDPERAAILAELAVALASGDLSAEEMRAILEAAWAEGLDYDGTVGWNALLGYPDASHLPDPAPLVAGFMGLYNENANMDEAERMDIIIRFLENTEPVGTEDQQWHRADFESLEEWMNHWGDASLEELARRYGYRSPAENYFSYLSPYEQASLYRSLNVEDFGVPLLNSLHSWQVHPMLSALPTGEAGLTLNRRNTLTDLNLSGLNLTGFNPAGKDVVGVNFAGSNIAAEQLNVASNYRLSNLSGLDLTGFNPVGKDVMLANFAGSTITAAQIAAADKIRGINLSGTGITRAELDAALIDAGKNPASLFFDTGTITF